MTQQQQPPQDDTGLDELQKKVQDLEKENAAKSEAEEQKIAQEDQSQQKITELTAALARAMADLSNYRRRTEEERMKWMHVAHADLLKMILPILDNFDRCAQHLPRDLEKNDWAKGVVRIHDDLMKILAKIGVKRIETVGQKIDAQLHEALINVPGKQDVIVAEFEPGYMLKDAIIKPAKVSVGNGEASDERRETGDEKKP